MKHYAVFINGVRGGTISFLDTDNGEDLYNKMLLLAPTVTLRQITDMNDVYIRENRHSCNVSIGGAMVRKMIESMR